MALTVEVARAILTEAKIGGFLEEEIPEDEAALLADGEYWLDAAKQAWAAGERSDTVSAIVNLGDGAEPAAESPKEEKKTSEPVPETDPEQYEHPLSAFIGKENLPIPHEIEGEPHDMPRDLTQLSDKEIRLLHGEYGAYLSRAKWLLAVSSSDVASATHLRDAAYRVALTGVDRVDEETGGKKLQAVIEAETLEDADYKKYDTQVSQHTERQRAYKALVEIYSGNVDRLSREWTMRQDEYNKTK